MTTFIDIPDLYYKLLKKYGSGKLDYKKYLEKIENNNAIAYGCQERNEANSFIKYLQSLDIVTKYKRPYTLRIGNRDIKRCNWLVGMVIDVIAAVENGATDIVLGVSNPDILPLVQYLKEKGVNTTVFACNIPVSLQKIANCIEIEKDLLESNLKE